MNQLESQIVTQLAKKIAELEKTIEQMAKSVVTTAKHCQLVVIGLSEANERISHLETQLTPRVSG